MPDRYPPLSAYGLLSDCHGSALVSRDGSVDWCCLPRFDARPVFARLLDWDRGGFFRIAPAGEYEVTRRYRPGTNILETTFRTRSGSVVLTDFMAIGHVDPDEEPRHDEPVPRAQDRLVRLVMAEGGPVEMEVDYRPRFDFGATEPYTTTRDDGLLVTYGGADALVLQCAVEMEADPGGASGSFTARPGERSAFVLSYQRPHRLYPRRIDPEGVERALDSTDRFWSDWSERCTFQGGAREAVVRSALVLKALTNLPTGAIVAAPTTSLPEEPGGVRNWDYRYAWLRDGAHVVETLFYLGYRSEAEAFTRWLHRTTAGRPEQLQIMYGPGGERLLPEVEVDGVEGYRGSRPVRVGNAAARQFQLDVFGDLLHMIWCYHSHGGHVDRDMWAEVREMVDHVERVWERPDSGIWEVRSEPRHFVHSRVMAWVALDRAVRLAQDLAQDLERTDVIDRWTRVRREIRDTVLREGVDPETGRIRRSFESANPDAAALRIPLLGFLPPDDTRVRATRRWIREALGKGDLIHRYLGPDGLPGGEGAFVACSFWAVEDLAMAGEVEEARSMFERLLELRNDLGLLPEEIDPKTGGFLGNFPQALSHIGLINAAVALAEEDGIGSRIRP